MKTMNFTIDDLRLTRLGWVLAFFILHSSFNLAHAYPPGPASQAQVNAGTEPYLYVTPATLAGKPGGSGSNNYTAGSGINISGSTIAVDGSVLRTNNISNITNIVDYTDIAFDTVYTNTSGSNLVVSVSMLNVGAFGTYASFTLRIDNDNNGSYEGVSKVQSVTDSAANSSAAQLTGWINPGGRYYYTNNIGSGLIFAGTSQRVYSPRAQSISVSGGGSGTTYTFGPTNLPLGTPWVTNGSSVLYPTNASLSAAQLAKGNVVTNYSTGTSLSDLSVSNGVYGELAINKNSATQTSVQVDSYPSQGQRTFIPHGLQQVFFDNAGGGSLYTHVSGRTGKSTSPLFGFKLVEGNSGQSPYLYNFDAFDDVSVWAAYYGYSTIPSQLNVPLLTGSGAGLNDLPVDDKALQSAEPLPPFVFTSGINGSSVANLGQVFLTNYTTSIFNDGIYAFATNNGWPLEIHMDANVVFWQTNRDANDYLSINPYFFPAGTNIINIVHNQGFKVKGTLYSHLFPTNDVLTVDVNGVLATGTNCTPSLTLNSAYKDMAKVMTFGLDGMRISDGLDVTSVGGYAMVARKITDAILYPISENNGQMVNYSAATTVGGRGRLAPIAIEALIGDFGHTPSMVLNQANIYGWDQPDSTLAWQGGLTGVNSYVADVNYFRAVYTLFANRIGPGHYFYSSFGFRSNYTTNETRLLLSLSAIVSSPIQIYAWTSGNFSGNYPILNWHLTNSPVFSKVLLDPAVNRPWKVWDNGPTNNSAYYKRLSDGSIAVALLNDANISTNLTVPFALITARTNVSYSATEAWVGALGTYSQSLTYTLGPTNGALILLTPLADAAQLAGTINNLSLNTNVVTRTNFVWGTVLLTTNVQSTNLTATPFRVTLTNNGIYQIEGSVPAAGLGSADRPNFLCYCTNAATAGNEWGFFGQISSQSLFLLYSYDEVSAGGYPYPLSSTGSGYGVGNGYNRLGDIGNTSGGPNLQNPIFGFKQMVQVTNAPVTLFYICNNDNGTTTTNIIKAGSWIKYQQQ